MFSNVRADLNHYVRFCYRGRPLWRVWPRIFYAHPAAAAVVWYRFGSFAWRARFAPARWILKLVYLLFMPAVRMYAGIQIQPTTRIGPGLAILHFGGGVLTEDCEIGANCLLHHNVNLVTMRSRKGPRIGDHFYAGVGATLIGDVVIGDRVTVGAGSVVTKSIPNDAVVAGVPARILRYRAAREDNAENRTLPAHPPDMMGEAEPSEAIDRVVSEMSGAARAAADERAASCSNANPG